MPDRILVINPNSTDAVTRAIDDAMAPLRITGGPGVDCMTLRQGPPGVESQSDADAVISILARSVPRHLRYIAAMGVGQRLAGG
jgi:allantoin racemase